MINLHKFEFAMIIGIMKSKSICRNLHGFLSVITSVLFMIHVATNWFCTKEKLVIYFPLRKLVTYSVEYWLQWEEVMIVCLEYEK